MLATSVLSLLTRSGRPRGDGLGRTIEVEQDLAAGARQQIAHLKRRGSGQPAGLADTLNHDHGARDDQRGA